MGANTLYVVEVVVTDKRIMSVSALTKDDAERVARTQAAEEGDTVISVEQVWHISEWEEETRA